MLSQRQLFLQYLAQTTDFPLMIEIEKAEGIHLFDPQGKKYIDLISGIAVSNVGHRHPRVMKAIHDQLERYLHVMVYGELIQSPQVRLAEKLAETLPPSLTSTYLVNSGSEAVEGALKLAKRYTGKAEIISCKDAYHGSTAGALSVSGNESFKQAFRPLVPGVKHIQFGELPDLDQISNQTAALIMETIQGEAGVRTANSEYFQEIRNRCDKTGTLLILDEVQCGFGRTGKFWGFEHYDVIPDILLCAKGMGGGMPIGAFISSPDIMEVLKHDPILGHITTFGGHPVSAAASLATVETLLEDGLIQDVEEKANIFRQKLVHPEIKEIRNKGLMMAVEFSSFETLKKIIDRAQELGVLTDWFLHCDTSMRIAPPLIIEETDIEQACNILLEAID